MRKIRKVLYVTAAALVTAMVTIPAAAQEETSAPDSSTSAPDSTRNGPVATGPAPDASDASRDSTTGPGSADGASSEPSVRRLEAAPVRDVAPAIDGQLDDEAWEYAPVATDFVQLEPDEGDPASEATEARILYGSDALYVAFRAYDSEPDRIAGQLTRRDQNSYSDWVLVAVDSYFDRRTAFTFAVNPVGVKRDVYMFEDTREDDSWDAVWDVATRIDDEGWVAEFRIPYSQLRFDGAAIQTWGLNLGREIARHDETSTWAPLSRTQDAMVSRFGLLQGLEDVETPNRLEVEPYTMARAERAPGDAANPFHEDTDLYGTVGADVKYGITNNLTLNLTLNPDFGQVEADPARVNLTAFETFLPEKRPFFLEGRSIFDFGIGMGDGGGSESLFYSRRIGRSPHGRADARGGWADAPENTTILGAWKLSGKTASGWSVGALHAVTGREEARIATGDGARITEPVEPLTNYSMGRLQKDFRNGRSALGLVGTATNRDGGVADRLGLGRAAYAGGFDFRHRFGTDGNYRLRGNVLGSYVSGSPEAMERVQRSSARYYQRPDADHVELDPTRAGLGGWASSLEVGKWGGGFWRAAGMVQARSPGFEVNDMGFQRNADHLATAAFLGYHVSEPGEHLRRWSLNTNVFRIQTFGGQRTELGANVNGGFTLNNLWGGHGGVNRGFGSYSTTLLRGGPALRTEPSWNGWGGLNSDSRKAVQVRLNTNWSASPTNGSWNYRVGSNVRWRPSGRMNLGLGPFVAQNVDDRQWVQNVQADGIHYLFGRLEQTTVGLTGRLETAFTPNLSLQLYAQPFVSAGTYGEFKEVADPGPSATRTASATWP